MGSESRRRAPQRVKAVAAAVAAMAAAWAVPAAAVTVITVDGLSTQQRWDLDENFDLLITSSGILDGSGAASKMHFFGNVTNNGFLGAGYSATDLNPGLLMAGYLRPGGTLLKTAAGTDTVLHHLVLNNSSAEIKGRLVTGAMLENRGTLAARRVANAQQSGRYPAFDLTVGTATIEGSWTNLGTARVNIGRVDIGGVDANGNALASSFTQLALPAANVIGPGAPPRPALNVGFMPGQGEVNVRSGSTFLLDAGDFDNLGSVANAGTMSLAAATRTTNGAGASFSNEGEFGIGQLGAAAGALPDHAIFQNFGSFVQSGGSTTVGERARFFNEGSFTVGGGSLTILEREGSGLVQAARGEWTNGRDGLLGVGEGATVDVGGWFLNFGTVENRGTMVFSSRQQWQTGDFGNPQNGGFHVFEGGTLRLQGAPGAPVFGAADGLLQLSAAKGDPQARLEIFIAGLSVRGTGHLHAIDDSVIDIDSGELFIDTGGRLTLDDARIDLRVGTFQTRVGSTVAAHASIGRGSLITAAGTSTTIGGTWTGDGVVSNAGSFRLLAGAQMAVRQFVLTDGVLDIEAGATLTTQPGAINGRLVMTGGTLKGGGVINGDVFGLGIAPPPGTDPTCGPNPTPGIACFTPGSSPGTLTINGTLTLGEGVVVELEIGTDANGALAFDQVLAQSIQFLPGVLVRVLVDENAPLAPGASFSMLSCSLGCDLAGATFQVVGADPSAFVVGAGGAFGYGIAPVPEPGTWATLAAGLAVLGGLAARRRAG